MNNLKTLAILICVFFSHRAISQDTVQIQVDLRNVIDDQVKVVFYPAQKTTGLVEYVMPAVIPGSYHRKDFGRFVNRFYAYTKTGKKLNVKKEGDNIFKIKKSELLDRIEYWVHDTWDAEDKNFIFQPGGTNIHDGQNFVINHQGFYGYLEGQKMLPYKITYLTNEKHFGFSPLSLEKNENSTIARASNYVRLVDNPIMFGKLDTLSFQSGNMKVHIGVYSENRVVRSSMIKESVEPLAKALTQFFGTLPVNNYYFIMYFPRYGKTGVSRYGGFGALEHSYCSFYFLPEISDKKQLMEMLQSIAGHEFLHILTPLHMHSEEIEFFDFRNPKMSEHLWMYEGVTEYFSHLVRISNKLMDEGDLIEEMNSKIIRASEYANVSFTTMSKNILSDPYQKMYSNVYEKGALIGFLLDIYISELSQGEKSLKSLMLQLAAMYGPEKPFKDEELIPQIVSLTYPEIETFFKLYVQGNTPLPFKEYFEKIGWEFYQNEEVDIITFGKINFFADKRKNRIEVLATESTKNVFGLKSGDVILEINDKKVDAENYEPLLLIEYPAHTEKVSIKYLRDDQTIEKKSAPRTKKELMNFFIKRQNTFNEKQNSLRKAVMNL